jgi:alpha-galactosidase
VLNVARQDVGNYLFDCIDDIVRASGVSCIKWDMNRDLTHAVGNDGRMATSRQSRAVYALMDRLREAHPDLEIESCASGGGRADYGVLERAHRIWTSDCTDALDRLEIQRGASMFFPPEVLGAHVSASPNHQTGRRHSLAFRAIVAFAYHFGIELNPLTLSADEHDELKGWIALHKKLRPTLHGPTGQFHLPPRDGRYVWGAAVEHRAVIVIAQGPQMMSEQPPPLRIGTSLPTMGSWRIAAMHPAKPEFVKVSDSQTRLLCGEVVFDRDALRFAGLPLPMLRPESGVVLELECIEGT